MNSFLRSLTENSASLYALNVFLLATLFTGLGLLTARKLAAHPAPLRHGLLVAALLLVFLSPLIAALSLYGNFGVLSLPCTLQDRSHELQSADLDPAESSREAHISAGWGEVESTTSIIPAARCVGKAFWLIWTAGAAWQLAVLLRGLWLVRRLHASLRDAADPRWSIFSEKASRSVGLLRRMRVAVSDMVLSPASVGILRPVVVIPASLESTLTDNEAECVLLHETAHIALHDHLTGFCQRLAGVVFWWHPLFRMLCRVVDEVKEELCDNYVVQSQGSGLPFARCLVRLAERAMRCNPLPTSLGVLGGRPCLEQRVANLLSKKQKLTWMTRRMALPVIAFATAAGALSMTCTVRRTASAATAERGSEGLTRAPAQVKTEQRPGRTAGGAAGGEPEAQGRARLASLRPKPSQPAAPRQDPSSSSLVKRPAKIEVYSSAREAVHVNIESDPQRITITIKKRPAIDSLLYAISIDKAFNARYSFQNFVGRATNCQKEYKICIELTKRSRETD